MNTRNYQDKDWLIEQYYKNNLSLIEIGELVGITWCGIRYWMRKHDIKIRKQYSHLKKLNQNKEHQSKAGKARAKWTNSHYSHFARERLLKQSLGKISHVRFKERDPTGYYERQRKAGIKAWEKNKQILLDYQRNFRETNPEEYYKSKLEAAIKGGEVNRQRITDWDFFNEHGMLKSRFPYPDEFNKELKKRIFNRDGGLCRICLKFICNGHAIHHIDYNKENNNESNLILLCTSCHGKTTMNKEYWLNYFKSEL